MIYTLDECDAHARCGRAMPWILIVRAIPLTAIIVAGRQYKLLNPGFRSSRFPDSRGPLHAIFCAVMRTQRHLLAVQPVILCI